MKSFFLLLFPLPNYFQRFFFLIYYTILLIVQYLVVRLYPFQEPIIEKAGYLAVCTDVGYSNLLFGCLCSSPIFVLIIPLAASTTHRIFVTYLEKLDSSVVNWVLDPFKAGIYYTWNFFSSIQSTTFLIPRSKIKISLSSRLSLIHISEPTRPY